MYRNASGIERYTQANYKMDTEVYSEEKQDAGKAFI